MKRYRQLYCVLCGVTSPLVPADSAELAEWVEIYGVQARHYCPACGPKLFERKEESP